MLLCIVVGFAFKNESLRLLNSLTNRGVKLKFTCLLTWYFKYTTCRYHCRVTQCNSTRTFAFCGDRLQKSGEVSMMNIKYQWWIERVLSTLFKLYLSYFTVFFFSGFSSVLWKIILRQKNYFLHFHWKGAQKPHIDIAVIKPVFMRKTLLFDCPVLICFLNKGHLLQ